MADTHVSNQGLRKLLISLGFSIGADFDPLIGLMEAAQRSRAAIGSTGTKEVTRTTAFAVLLNQGQNILDTLRSLGLQYDQFLSSIGLKFPVSYGTVFDVDIYVSFEDALVQYANTKGAVLSASKEVLAIAILEHALVYPHIELELEGRLRSSGIDTKRLAEFLRSRELPFDPRRQRGFTGDLERANKLRAAGRPEEALLIYQQMARQFPGSPVVLTGMAETLRSLGQHEKALDVYQEVSAQFPDDLVARTGIAAVRRELHRLDETSKIEEESGKLTNQMAAQQGAVLPGESNEKRTAAPFYSDHPARQDLLNRKAVAETIATMIESVWQEDAKENDVDRTFIVHLHGRWGSGKTSILNFMKDALLSQNGRSSLKTTPLDNSGHPSWVIVDYNAWRNQTLGPAWWTLLEGVYRQARKQLGGWRHPKCMSLILRDYWWRTRSSYAPFSVASVLAVFVGLAVVWLWRVDLFGAGKPWLTEGLKLIGSAFGFIVALFAFAHNYQIGSARTAKTYLELSRDPLSPLTRRYGELVAQIGRPVAVFIDDLDRCNAEFVVELLQTIQTLFRHARVLYVVAADRDWICASYQQQYKSFGEMLGEPGKSLGHLFLEKIFQLSVEVPRLLPDERDVYWDKLINSKASQKLEENQAVAVEIVAELEKANTESEIIGIVDRYRNDPIRADIAAVKGFQRMQAAPLVKEREHFLSAYAQLIEPNPRAMKRLLNAYGFRRGFDIQSQRKSDPDALVRWTILENRWPILADYLEGRSGGRAEAQIINALKSDPEVLEVAKGLTWDKLRPVASAPDQPPATNITPGVDTKISSAVA
jgi:hypothetical protein